MDRTTKGFVLASLVYFLLAALLGVHMGHAEGAGWVRFAHVHFNLLGFMSMMVYGVGYFILPRFNGRTLRWPSWLPVHFVAANIGLVGMVAASPSRPSGLFTLFAALSVASAAMFVVNLGATMLLEPAKTEDADEAKAAAPAASGAGAPSAPPPAPPPATVAIDPDTRVGEILSRWPETVEVFVARGFASLADPAHREQVMQMPVTLRMACQRHNVDLEAMVARLTAVAGGYAATPPLVAAAEAVPAPAGAARKGTVARGQPIRPDDVLGDIIAVYPETAKVFRKYYGDGCFSCPGQATESVRQSALMHNVSEPALLSELNRAAGF